MKYGIDTGSAEDIEDINFVCNCPGAKVVDVSGQQAVRMFYLDEKSYKEISDSTGIDWNRVRSLIQNGRRNLKNCMDKNS